MKDALALALMHFIWQGAVLAIVGGILMRVTKVPTVRYAVGVATMIAMLLAPVMTFLTIQRAADAAQRTTTNQEAVASPGAAAPNGVQVLTSRNAAPAANPTTWILNVWALGVIVLSLRFAGGLAMAHRLATRNLTPVSGDLQRLAARLAARLNVQGAVRVCESASVAVPIMIGWLRPVIVLPPAALVGLPAAQLEALLAHELAHIRRHDYLVNLLQTGVETLCFYHPAVWWVSREVRRHREHCCDDVAVGVCDRLTYVTALSALASIATPQCALSAAGGALRDRVQRLIAPTTHTAATRGAWMAMLPILLVVSLVAPHAWGEQAPAPVPAAPAAQAKPAPSVVPPVPIDVQRHQVTPRASPRVERTDLRARRAELEIQTEQLAARQELAELESRLRQEELALARARRLAEIGLATQEVRARAEEQVAHARRQVEAAKAHRTLREQEHVVRRAEVDLERRAHAEIRALDRERIEHLNLSALDAAAALQPQDLLTITIADEPDLPTHFTVRADGSIRFPLLGSIRVQGSTTSQVQSAIQKLITDKGLAVNPAVTVSARRAK